MSTRDQALSLANDIENHGCCAHRKEAVEVLRAIAGDADWKDARAEKPEEGVPVFCWSAGEGYFVSFWSGPRHAWIVDFWMYPPFLQAAKDHEDQNP